MEPIQEAREDGADVDGIKHRVYEGVTKVQELEQKVNALVQFYSSLSKKQLKSSRVAKERHVFTIRKAHQQQAASGKRMQELMRQFGTIFRQITTHRWADPFMYPVDVEGLGLDDYYEVIEKPMDFSTIKKRMEAKDGTGYKNVREIYSDVRLIFKNAMTYNDDSDDVHRMAKFLLEKFEEKWLLLLPKVTEEETRQEEEETKLRLGMQLAQEAANAKTAKDLSNDLNELEGHLDTLREQVLEKCRKMSAEEKKKLGGSLERLRGDDLNKALELIARNNSDPETVEVRMDIQSESTLSKLKFFVEGALEAAAAGDNNILAKTGKKRKK